MKNKLSTITKSLLLIAAAGLVVVLFTPIWRIDLDAPQYPEGLFLTIHASGLRGNVDIINGLNHYIGMKTLHNEDFIEFKVLPYIIIFFAVLFVITAFLNRRSILNISFMLFVLFGVIAMYDFWKWEYDYGHNLDPNAAIIVPDMAYQPPLIGFKQLLNFGAYSFPDIGGWIFVGVGILLLVSVVLEWKKAKAFNTYKKTRAVVATSLICIFFSSCQAGPQPITPGTDVCHFCKMNISDIKYAAELVTKKGKVYKFDDIHCLLSFNKSNTIQQSDVKDVYVSDYTGNHELINVKEALLLKGGDIHGPMNGDVIAFRNKDSLKKIASQLNAIEGNWDQIIK